MAEQIVTAYSVATGQPMQVPLSAIAKSGGHLTLTPPSGTYAPMSLTSPAKAGATAVKNAFTGIGNSSSEDAYLYGTAGNPSTAPNAPAPPSSTTPSALPTTDVYDPTAPSAYLSGSGVNPTPETPVDLPPMERGSSVGGGARRDRGQPPVSGSADLGGGTAMDSQPVREMISVWDISTGKQLTIPKDIYEKNPGLFSLTDPKITVPVEGSVPKPLDPAAIKRRQAYDRLSGSQRQLYDDKTYDKYRDMKGGDNVATNFYGQNFSTDQRAKLDDLHAIGKGMDEGTKAADRMAYQFAMEQMGRASKAAQAGQFKQRSFSKPKKYRGE